MPAQGRELVDLTIRLCDNVVAPDCIEDHIWQDGTRITEQEAREVFALGVYELRLRHKPNKPAQRKAMILLRRHLNPNQRRELGQGRYFYATASNGGTYRIYPHSGRTEQVERHGKHYYGKKTFCLHPFPCNLPNGDLALAHLLLLRCDEDAFLKEANATAIRSQMWDGEYLRRMRQGREQRRQDVTEARERVLAAQAAE